MNVLRKTALKLTVRFSRRGRLALARKWHTWYMDEIISGVGLRYDFDLLPQSDISARVRQLNDSHSADLNSLDRRIAGFIELYEFLMLCPRSWRFPNEFAYPGEDRFSAYTITDYALAYLYQMHRSLKFYAKLLRDYAGTIDVIEDAVMDVAGVIHPAEWRGYGRNTPPIPNNADACIRWYLEAMIATEGRIIDAPNEAASSES